MAESINLGNENDGRQEFEFNGKKITVDILEVCNHIFKLKDHVDTNTLELNEDIVKYLESLGFTNVSQFAAVKFTKAIGKIAAELKKNIELNV